MEGITNGFGLWLLAAVLPILNFGARLTRAVSIGMVITAWTIVIASMFDPLFTEARGLAVDSSTNLLNDTAFILFVIGILIVIAIMVKIAVACLLTQRSSQ